MHLPSRLGSLPCITTPISNSLPATPRLLCRSCWPGCQPYHCNGPHYCYGRRARLLRAPQRVNSCSNGRPAIWALHTTSADSELPACAGSTFRSSISNERFSTGHRRSFRMGIRVCSKAGRQEEVEEEDSHQWVYAQVTERTEEESLGSDDDDDDAVYPSLQAVQDSRRQEGNLSDGRDAFCVVNFYHLTDVAEPSETLRAHREGLRHRDVRGRIYITSQGINAQYSGPQKDAHGYALWVGQQPGFEELRWTSDPARGHQFPRLRLKNRENLVSLAGGTRRLPITQKEARAKPLAPLEWREMLRNATLRSPDGFAPRPVVLDVRNGYEHDAGHFAGAERPVEEQFNQTPTDGNCAEIPQPLAGIAPDTPVMMYCTGGIRCDIYSAYLRQKGFNNLYTLEGGIANFLRQLGPADVWRGSMFTFDNRLALAPEDGRLQAGSLEAAVPCQCCSGSAVLPHMNCANLDCNKLFVACPQCQEQLRGCCCESCLDAPRLLRPIKSGGQYGSWNSYSGSDSDCISTGRGPGRLERRRRRKERLREKYDPKRAERQKRRDLVKAVMEEERQKGQLPDDRIARLALLTERLEQISMQSASHAL